MVGAIEANYVGYRENDGHWVNVRNRDRHGNPSDGGVIRQFATKEEALSYVNEINNTGVDRFESQEKLPKSELYAKDASTQIVYAEYPHISWIRAVTGILSYEQIDAINQTRRLPDNVKIMQNGAGGYTIGYNYFGIRAGTRTVPMGFELKKDVFGFAHVVPMDTDGLLY